MKRHRSSLLCAASLLVVLLTATGCGRGQRAASADAEADSSNALAIRAQTVTARPFERRFTVQGTLEAKVFANVSARSDGNLDELWVDKGDAVVGGKTALFQVDPISRQNSVTIAEQNLAVARASLEVARASAEKIRAEARKANLDFERFARLHKEGKVSNSEYEAAEVGKAQAKAGVAVADAQLDLSERQVRLAEASLAIAQKNLADTKIVAPISGVVSARLVEPGEQMFAGRVVLRIEDLTTVEAAAFLPAQYYAEVIPGEAEFRLVIGRQAVGTYPVTYRSPTINPTLRTFEIKGRVTDASKLAVPGSMAELTLVFETRQGLAVPSASILTRSNKPAVFVVEGKQARLRFVEPGLQNDGWTEILSGLNAGDTIVVEGQTQLRDGQNVTIY